MGLDNPRYFLTAYGIARKHGFLGTEEEWLTSLSAYGMAVAMGYEGSEEEWLEKLNDPVPEFRIGEVVTLPGGSYATVSISGTKDSPVLNFGIPRGLGMADALPRTGGTMQGDINMDGHKVTGLHTPDNEHDAVPKNYADKIKNEVDNVKNKVDNVKNEVDNVKNEVENALQKSGGIMTGPIDMSGRSILNVATPTTGAGAANKGYVDAKRLRKAVDVPASGWTGDVAPYTQGVAIEGLQEGDCPHIGCIYSGDLETKQRQKEACSYICDGTSANNMLTLICFEDKPDVDLALMVEVNR